MVMAISPDLLPKEAFESAFEDFERDCAGHEDEATPRNRCVPMSASRTVASERLEQLFIVQRFSDSTPPLRRRRSTARASTSAGSS